MKRLFMILGLAVVACITASAFVYVYQTKAPSDEWMGQHLGLSGPALAEFTEAHNRYAATCAGMCVKIRNSNAHLAGLVRNSTAFTPEIADAMARSDALLNECRQNMLRHFYEVAALLDESKRDSYLDLVLPLIIDSEMMTENHRHP